MIRFCAMKTDGKTHEEAFESFARYQEIIILSAPCCLYLIFFSAFFLLPRFVVMAN